MSALVPGLGQLYLGKKRQGALFLTGLIIVALLWWPVRIPSRWPGLIALIWGVFILCVASTAALIVTSKTARASRWWLVLFVPIALASSIGHVNWLTRAAGFGPYLMVSRSMEPTIMVGDVLVSDLRYFGNRAPTRSEVIMFRKDNLIFVKRVAAVEGDTIEGRNGVIFVNANRLEEPYTQHIGHSGDYPEIDNFGPVSVPAGKLFVLGDNRDLSRDSRIRGFGLIDVKALRGKILYVTKAADFNRLGKTIN